MKERTAIDAISIEIPYQEETAQMINEMNPNSQQREIARMLGINADDLAAKVALNSSDTSKGVMGDGTYVTTCVNRTTGLISLNSLDASQNSSDPDELLRVLSGKVQNLVAMRKRGGDGTRFEAEIRDVQATTKRLLEAVIGRESA
jgi:hypothetical protein